MTDRPTDASRNQLRLLCGYTNIIRTDFLTRNHILGKFSDAKCCILMARSTRIWPKFSKWNFWIISITWGAWAIFWLRNSKVGQNLSVWPKKQEFMLQKDLWLILVTLLFQRHFLFITKHFSKIRDSKHLCWSKLIMYNT